MTIKTYLINKINAQRHRLNGIIPSNRLPNKRNLCRAFRDNIIYSQTQLPPKVDLRNDMTTVEDQSQVGSCAANALAGAYEYLTKKQNGRNTDVSRLFIYYNARSKNKKFGSVTDSGCSMASAIEALEEFGTCLESTWAYDISKVNTRPNDQAYRDAKDHTISEALEVAINLSEMKSCLAQGYPFAFGLRLFSSFDKATDAGLVPMPDGNKSVRKTHGCHALLAVGYSDRSKVFIVRNSWGETWGDKGYCYIPYEYMTDPALCFDAWAIRNLTNSNFGQENWDMNDIVNYQNILTYNNGSDNNENNYVIQDLNEDDDNNSMNASANSYPMYGNNYHDNFSQACGSGDNQINSNNNSYPPVQWNTNQNDQQNWTNNQFGVQNRSYDQFSVPNQQMWNNDNNTFSQHQNETNPVGQQVWGQGQFDQQQIWNNTQFSGTMPNQFNQPTWTSNQFQQPNSNNFPMGSYNQQHFDNTNIYQSNPVGQDVWNNNANNQPNQSPWTNNQYNQPYQDNTFGSQYPGNYGGNTSSFGGASSNNPTPGNYGYG